MAEGNGTCSAASANGSIAPDQDVSVAGNKMLRPTWTTRRATASVPINSRIDRTFGLPDFGGGSRFSKVHLQGYRQKKEYDRAVEEVGLVSFFRRLHDNKRSDLNSIFSSDLIKTAVDYYDANKEKPSVKAALGHLTPQKGLTETGDQVITTRKYGSVILANICNALPSLSDSQYNIFYRGFSRALTGFEFGADKESIPPEYLSNQSLDMGTKKNIIPTICVVPLIWAMELCSRSFGNRLNSDNAISYPINPNQEAALIDYAWAAALANTIFPNTPTVDPRQLSQLGLYGWGAIFSRLRLQEAVNSGFYSRTDYTEKLERVGRYASIAKEMFLMKEQALPEYLDPTQTRQFIFPHWVDFHAIKQYPEYVENLKDKATESEKKLANTILRLNNYLECSFQEAFRRQQKSETPYGIADGEPFHNALAYETAYDNRFTIPKEGENQFVKRILDTLLTNKDNNQCKPPERISAKKLFIR